MPRSGRAAARGEITIGLQEKAQDWLTGYGYDIAVESDEFRSFALKFARIGQQGSNIIRRRDQGEFIDTPAAPSSAPSQSEGTKGPLLSEVVDYFLENYDQH